MSGFFGLFNYDKEGPGISKDAPKKKTFIVFFETFFRNFWKFIPINLVYSLISLPLLTNGFANVGITNVARNTARDKHSFGISDFFETIKKNLKQSLIAGIINTLVFAFLIFDIWFFYNSQGAFATVGLSFCSSLLLIFIMMGYYMWTLIITFKFSLKQIYANSFKFVFVNFKYSVLCLFINVLLLALNLLVLFWVRTVYVVIIEVLLLILIYPCFNALLVQYCTFPSIKKFIIDPYYAQHPDEDIEKRKSLGLEIEQNKAEPIFSEEIDKEVSEEDDDNGVIFED